MRDDAAQDTCAEVGPEFTLVFGNHTEDSLAVSV